MTATVVGLQPPPVWQALGIGQVGGQTPPPPVMLMSAQFSTVSMNSGKPALVLSQLPVSMGLVVVGPEQCVAIEAGLVEVGAPVTDAEGQSSTVVDLHLHPETHSSTGSVACDRPVDASDACNVGSASRNLLVGVSTHPGKPTGRKGLGPRPLPALAYHSPMPCPGPDPNVVK